MQAALTFVFVLGVLVFVHELGHFLLARWNGVRVLTFSLGFGPKLLTLRRGDTEYCISAIPLGGYVKMAGERPGDARTGAPDEYLSKTKWQRFQILIMGPMMNVAFAVVLMAAVAYQPQTVPLFGQQPVVVASFADDSVALPAGVRIGDAIVRVDRQPIANWDALTVAVSGKAGREVTLGVERDGRRLDVAVVPRAQGRFETGDLGIRPKIHPQIESVDPGHPAADAGLKPGDVVLAAGGEQGISQAALIAMIRASADRPIVLEIRRDGARQAVTLTPRTVGSTAIVGAKINSLEVRTVAPTLIEAGRLSLGRNVEWATQIAVTLGGLFTGGTPVKSLAGPIGIAAATGAAVEQSWVSLFTLMAFISLNLGLFNLMPIPVLDGGHIAILGLEGISRRQFSLKVKERMLLAGFALLLMLMATVIYNDLMRVRWLA